MHKPIHILLDELTEGADLPGGEPAPEPAPTEIAAEPAPVEEGGPAEPASMLEAMKQGVADESAPAASAEAATAKAAPEPKPAEPGKSDDPYQMPEDLKGRSRERFQKLADIAKESTQRAESLERDVQGFKSMMEDAGASGQDIVQYLGYVKALNTGNVEQALNMLDQQRKVLVLALGRDVNTDDIDPLSDHPDLKQAVSNGMDRRYALEVARTRMASQQDQHARQQQERQQSEVRSQQQALSDAANAIDTLAQQWAANDIDYPAKEAYLLKMLPDIQKSFPPQQWAAALQMAYKNITTAPPAPQSRAPGMQPLRATGKTSSGAAPKSMLDAMKSGAGYEY